MRFLILMLAAGLSACVTDNSNEYDVARSVLEIEMKNGLMSLIGQPIKSAFATLGYPSSKTELGSETMYVWTNEGTDLVTIPTVDSDSRRDSRYRRSLITGNEVVPVSYKCTVKVVADKLGNVVGWDWRGNVDACSPYAERLGHAAH